MAKEVITSFRYRRVRPLITVPFIEVGIAALALFIAEIFLASAATTIRAVFVSGGVGIIGFTSTRFTAASANMLPMKLKHCWIGGILAFLISLAVLLFSDNAAPLGVCAVPFAVFAATDKGAHRVYLPLCSFSALAVSCAAVSPPAPPEDFNSTLWCFFGATACLLFVLWFKDFPYNPTISWTRARSASLLAGAVLVVGSFFNPEHVPLITLISIVALGIVSYLLAEFDKMRITSDGDTWALPAVMTGAVFSASGQHSQSIVFPLFLALLSVLVLFGLMENRWSWSGAPTHARRSIPLMFVAGVTATGVLPLWKALTSISGA